MLFHGWERKTWHVKQCEKQACRLFQGSTGIVADEHEALEIAEEIGFPVIIKATAGGGGKGIRVARNKEDLINRH